MAEPDLMDTDATDRSALEQFVYDNAVLERLEAALDVFNPFVTMRWTRQEAGHSSHRA